MVDKFEPALVPNPWLRSGIPWVEYISKSAGNPQGGSSHGAAFGYDGCTAVFTLLVEYDNGPQLLLDVFGSAAYDKSTGKLSRVPPVNHPYFSHLYAKRIVSMQGVQWLSKVHPLGARAAPGNIGAASYSGYRYWMATISFDQRPYRLLDDVQLDGLYGVDPRAEWYRWCEIVPQGSVEVLSRDVGSFSWAEGTALGGATPKIGVPFASPLGQSVTRMDYLITQRALPYEGFFNPTTLAPTRQMAALNTVNDATFMGFPAGVLKYAGFRATPVQNPVPPNLLGLQPMAGDSSLLVDVEHHFGFMDPPPGGASRGHNLCPFPGGGGLWWLVTSDGTPTGKTIIPKSSFPEIFKGNL